MKKLISTLFALSFIGAAGLALADVTANTPGAACVAASGTLINGTAGEAANLAPSAATAVCPIDRSLGTSLSTKVSATVWVLDENTSANVCCTLDSKNPGGALVSSPQVCSTGASNTYQSIPLAQITDGYTYSHFYISCSVPGTDSGIPSKILTYRSVQN